MLSNLRGWEWVILLLIVLLLFGARKLPDLARSVGKSMKIFKSEVKDLKGEDTPAGTAPRSSGTAPSETSTTSADTADDGEPKNP